MAHTGLGIFGMVGGGGGGAAYILKFCSRMDVKLIVYCLETPLFVVTNDWLQLSDFAVRKLCGYNKVLFYCIETQKL